MIQFSDIGKNNGMYGNGDSYQKQCPSWFQAYDPKTDGDDLIYADSDYRDLYAYGPVTYSQASKMAAEKKRQELAKYGIGTLDRKYQSH